mmetsp:Transcript_1990/g.7120  ORF Transcript_1990/g.7120 Transcript_1990/m.7120 type:complete len:253 (-) Transcript_1990:9-767(-)
MDSALDRSFQRLYQFQRRNTRRSYGDTQTRPIDGNRRSSTFRRCSIRTRRRKKKRISKTRLVSLSSQNIGDNTRLHRRRRPFRNRRAKRAALRLKLSSLISSLSSSSRVCLFSRTNLSLPRRRRLRRRRRQSFAAATTTTTTVVPITARFTHPHRDQFWIIRRRFSQHRVVLVHVFQSFLRVRFSRLRDCKRAVAFPFQSPARERAFLHRHLEKLGDEHNIFLTRREREREREEKCTRWMMVFCCVRRLSPP